jgi:hypothetical protein
MSIFITVYCLISVFQFSFSWNPETTRNLKIAPGSCAGPLPVCVALAGINMVTDIVIFLLPIALVWNLPLTGWAKFGVILTFILGSL